ncbi:MAG: cation:proton antiporter [Pseudomonadota bacterium]
MHGPLPLLILQIGVIIVAARLVGILARRVEQPAVIAEVIAGILLGPSLLGRLAPGTFDSLFPKFSLAGLSLLSQVGLVLFMFLIGLELDPKLLRGRGASSFAISAAGICVPFGLGALLALQIYGSRAEHGASKTSFVLFMGIAMSITAFPVLARILAERKLIRTKMGAIALACAAADDVTAWCLLALVVSFVHATGPLAALFTMLEVGAFAAFMLFIVRPLLARFGARITTPENLTQNVVAFTFVLLLASAFTSEVIGVHALFGAFLFGTIMPRQGNYAHALAERLEDFVVVAFLPLFFAYSGLRTQLGLLNSASDWALCVTLTAVACIGKFGGSFFAARLTGMPTRDALGLGVLMNTRGLMELIVLNLGLDLGVISPRIFTMMVIMALVTTFMTTPLLKLVAAASLLAEDTPKPALPSAALPAAPARLLLCVGDAQSGPAMALLAISCSVGKRSESVALHLERPRDRTSRYLEQRPGQSRGLSATLETAAAAGMKLESVSFDSSDPGADICDFARARRSTHVVLGMHRPVLGQNLFGGSVGEIMADSPVPVALLADRGLVEAYARRTDPAVRRVLAALCGGTEDFLVLEFAEQLLADPAISLRVLSAEPLGASGRALTARATDLVEKYAPRVELRSERTATRQDAVLRHAESAALVLIGLDKAWGLSRDGLGAEALRLLSDSPASFLVLHAPPAQPA